ncbi:MAG: hypothetical protein SF029_12015 [bacterium]|nr:hypothetical protein [bacterium]
MLDSAIFEVAIGLVFIFSLLAILVTQINTFIVNVLNLRAKQLKESLLNLVTDKDVQAKLLAHPLISMVKTHVAPTDDLSRAQAERVTRTGETQVTYIEPETFVDALLDILAHQLDILYTRLQDAADSIPNSDQKSKIRELIRVLRSGFSEQTIRSLREAFEAVEDGSAREKLMAVLDEVENALNQLNFKSDQLVPALEGVRNVTDKAFQIAMDTLLTSAQTLEDAKDKLARWFNEGMERATEVYKRKMGYISLAVAFGLAVILNVDTLHLARALWEDPELRQAVVNQANEIVTNPPPGFMPEATPAVIVPEATAQPIDPEDVDAGGSIQQVEQSIQDIDRTVQQLLELELPIGWEYLPVTEEMLQTSQALGLPTPRQNARNLWNLIPGNSPYFWTIWLQKIIGLLATTLAAAQGAPFWFDLLNRIARPRASS